MTAIPGLRLARHTSNMWPNLNLFSAPNQNASRRPCWRSIFGLYSTFNSTSPTLCGDKGRRSWVSCTLRYSRRVFSSSEGGIDQEQQAEAAVSP